ncbi:MAG: crossover junction endodeoxyribonuclease RuvC [Patescibacteria group bacterium]|nr:crossover junction endodeoxyribonuclease RuvC [Patescibacteria group bacterium]
MQPKRILAFDPGFERLGVAVVERQGGRDVLIYSDCVRTKKHLPFPTRLQQIGEAATELIKRFEPRSVALENVYFEKNAKTAMKVAQVRGVLCFLAAKAGLEVLEYTPLEVKVAVTGYGKSDKRAVSEMVGRLVRIPPGKRLDDELDAIAIGLTGLAIGALR